MSEKRRDKVVLAGHSHVDLAWLWTKDETIHLVVEGMVNYTLRLMDEFPFVKFSQSSAQIYKWIEQYYPELFSRIKEKVQSGSWEIVGGSWSEFSPNLIPEEALVRQYLYGKLYFKERFGKDTRIAWLPDSFGFPWTMPQVLKKSGIDYFMTNKLNWQLYRNKRPIPFPYYVFTWQGPDGSSVLSHLTPGPYNGPVREQLTLDLLSLMKAKHGVNELLYLYGYGDHGGGIVKYMIKDGIDLGKDNPQLEVKFGTVEEFYSDLSKFSGIPVYADELYLKTHRGTFTTESRIKRAMRELDERLTLAERLAAMAFVANGKPYPKEELRRAWEALLYMTTHDIADGTSLKAVYDEIFSEEYPTVVDITEKLMKDSASSLFGPTKGSLEEGDFVLVFNPLSWAASKPIEISAGEGLGVTDERGNVIPSQLVEEEAGKKLIFVAEGVPGLGYRSYKVTKAREASGNGVIVGEWFLENDKLRVELDPETGLLSRIYDKRSGREVLDGSKRGNVLQLYEDIPPNAPTGEPAWNLYLEDKRELKEKASMRVSSGGPLMGTIVVERKYEKSRFVQEVSLRAASDVIEFTLKADWNEKYSTLKVSFPLSFASDYATYGVQFGSVQRFRFDLEGSESTLDHPNRKWEEADTTKFEVPAQRWVSVDEKGGAYGVSLIVRDKFAFSHEGNEIKITMLRGPRREDRLKDRWVDQSSEVGEHVIKYSLYPHAGDWKRSKTPNLAYEQTVNWLVLNLSKAPSDGPARGSYLEISPSSLVLTAFKISEEGNDAVVRIYNPYDEAVKGSLVPKFRVSEAQEVDLMENGEYIRKPLRVDGGRVELDFGPFEIKTVRLKM